MRLLQTFQSVYELLPDSFYLDNDHSLLTDATKNPPVTIKGVNDTYYLHPWHLPPDQHTRIKQAMAFKERLGRALPGEQNLVIYGTAQPTYAYASFKGRIEYPEKLPDGDATITIASANHDTKATRVAISGLHSRLPNLEVTHAAIREFLAKRK